MTEEQKIICKQFLNDADKTHSCNEYKLLMELLEQEPRKGHWIVTAEEYYKAINEKGGGVNENTSEFITGIDVACSECLERYNFIDNQPERFYYCPNCGRY